MRISLLFITVIFLIKFSYPQLYTENKNKIYDVLEDVKVEGKTLVLSNGRKVKTTLFDLKYIGQIKTKSKSPYFILSGRSCSNCDENISIYVWCPDDGPMLSNGKQPRYSYPGKERDYSNLKIIYENRMFYGNCTEYGNSVIWIENSLNQNKKWINSLFIVRVNGNSLEEIKITSSIERKKILEKIKNCHELIGIETTSEP